MFFSYADYAAYIDLMGEWYRHHEVDIWACCLTPNHVHQAAGPETGDALWLAIGKAQPRYTRYINFREGRGGHLWQWFYEALTSSPWRIFIWPLSCFAA